MVRHFSECQFHEYHHAREGKQESWCWYGLQGCIHPYVYCPCRFARASHQEGDTLADREAQFRPANELKIRGME